MAKAAAKQANPEISDRSDAQAEMILEQGEDRGKKRRFIERTLEWIGKNTKK